MKRVTIIIALTLMTVATGWAQVKANLSMLADNETYLVSLVPEVDYQPPYNTTGSIQIVVRVPVEYDFHPSNIQSLLPGVNWLNNAYVDDPEGGAGYTFASFVMDVPTTKNIKYQDGVEVPLFTFTSSQTGCLGEISLLDNEDPMVRAVIKGGYNVTNNLPVLGRGGNAFSGVLTSTLNCDALTTSTVEQVKIIPQLRVFPVPASEKLTVEYTMLESTKELDLQLRDMAGASFRTLGINGEKGSHRVEILLDDLPEGIYAGQFVNPQGVVEHFRFLVFR
jgi:hypothetical protein